jgi:hypothetical protein
VVNEPDSRKPAAGWLTAGWGALWGLGLGAWLLAPLVVNVHFVRPQTISQWIVLEVGLGAVFAALGAFLGICAGIVLVFKESHGRFRDRGWAFALAQGPLLAAAYLADSVFIHWINYHSFSGLSAHAGAVGPITVAWLVISILFFLLYTQLTARINRPRPVWLIAVLGFAVLAGGALLPLRTDSGPSVAPSLGHPTPFAVRTADRPLLFIGLDSGTWRVLEPLIESGDLPHFRALYENGIHGDVDALWPPYWSGAAWAAIVTGLPRETTGVYEDLAASVPGLPLFQVPLAPHLFLNPVYSARYLLMAAGAIRYMPPPRALLNGEPFWEFLHRAGISTAVIRFRFTYPATDRAEIVVSDWVGRDQWQMMGVQRESLTGAVTPEELASELMAPFSASVAPDEALVSQLLPPSNVGRPVDAITDPALAVPWASDIDQRTFEVSELILKRDPGLSVLAIYLDGFDLLAHAFWQYRFPEDFHENRPASTDVERLKPVLDRYLRYLDARLGRLLALYEIPPDVLIVSDHGHGARTTVASTWRGWHSTPGVFLLSGPQVPASSERIRVSYYDVVPTVLHLKQLEKPAALQGSSVLHRITN